MSALTAFAAPVFVSIFAIGLAFAPSWLVILWIVAMGWFVVLIHVERSRLPRLIDPSQAVERKR